jgi:hypothetical protein
MPHHGDKGYNALSISYATNFWVRNVRPFCCCASKNFKSIHVAVLLRQCQQLPAASCLPLRCLPSPSLWTRFSSNMLVLVLTMALHMMS